MWYKSDCINFHQSCCIFPLAPSKCWAANSKPVLEGQLAGFGFAIRRILKIILWFDQHNDVDKSFWFNNKISISSAKCSIDLLMNIYIAFEFGMMILNEKLNIAEEKLWCHSSCQEFIVKWVKLSAYNSTTGKYNNKRTDEKFERNNNLHHHCNAHVVGVWSDFCAMGWCARLIIIVYRLTAVGSVCIKSDRFQNWQNVVIFRQRHPWDNETCVIRSVIISAE